MGAEYPNQVDYSGCCSSTRGAGLPALRLARPIPTTGDATRRARRGRAGTGLPLLRAGVPPERRTHLSLGAAIMRRSTGKQERVVPRGLEPRTLRLLAVRSNQLSYETSCRLSAGGAINSSRSWASPRAGRLLVRVCVVEFGRRHSLFPSGLLCFMPRAGWLEAAACATHGDGPTGRANPSLEDKDLSLEADRLKSKI